METFRKKFIKSRGGVDEWKTPTCILFKRKREQGREKY